MFDHDEKLVEKASKWKRTTRASSKVHIPALFIPLEVLKPAILEPPVDLFKTARAVVHDGFEESKKAKTPAKVDDIVEIAPEPTESNSGVFGHSDVASKIMAAADTGKSTASSADSGKPPTAPRPGRTKSFYETYLAPTST